MGAIELTIAMFFGVFVSLHLLDLKIFDLHPFLKLFQTKFAVMIAETQHLGILLFGLESSTVAHIHETSNLWLGLLFL
jgi:hypothetical protein